MDELLDGGRAKRQPAGSTLRVLGEHWPEYLMEAAELGSFMVSACLFTALLAHPASPVVRALPDAVLRRGITGVAMGLTAVAIVYSPWGKQSGAHLNPSLTLTFLRLGKVRPLDALFYVLAQFLGGMAGVRVAAALLGGLAAHPSVNYVVTLPGSSGPLVAFAAELLISFLMMSVVLRAAAHERLGRYTGMIAGTLLATFILLEAPYSGMSMSPARTFGSAFAAQLWHDLWIYFTAPPLGMLLAGELFRVANGGRAPGCAKLHHQNGKRCIHCGYRRECEGTGSAA